MERLSNREILSLGYVVIGITLMGASMILYCIQSNKKESIKQKSQVERILGQYDNSRNGELNKKELSNLLEDYQLIQR